jgi:hypothetical protein
MNCKKEKRNISDSDDIEMNSRSILIGSAYFLPYSVDYVWDNSNDAVPTKTVGISLNINNLNFNGSHEVRCALNKKDLNAATPFLVTFQAGEAIAPCIVDLSNAPSSNKDFLDLYVNIRGDRKEYYVIVQKRHEFSENISSPVGYKITKTFFTNFQNIIGNKIITVPLVKVIPSTAIEAASTYNLHIQLYDEK